MKASGSSKTSAGAIPNIAVAATAKVAGASTPKKTTSATSKVPAAPTSANTAAQTSKDKFKVPKPVEKVVWAKTPTKTAITSKQRDLYNDMSMPAEVRRPIERRTIVPICKPYAMQKLVIFNIRGRCWIVAT